VLEALASALGPVTSCCVLDSKRDVGVWLAALPDVKAAHISWGYVWVTPAALA